MQPLEVSGALRTLEWSLGVKGLINAVAALYLQSSLCLYDVHVDTFLFVLADLIKLAQTVFWNDYLIIALYIEWF